MKRLISFWTSISCAAVVAATVAMLACSNSDKPRAGPTPIDPQDSVSARMYPALRNTIQEFAMVADSVPLRVEGYGLVVQLPGTGSGDMQPNIREILRDELFRVGAGSYMKGTQDIQPDRILASNDVAAVEVRGMIPPYARRGTHFDLQVTVVPNSQTVSIANGLLWTSELKTIGLTADTGADTSTIAFGRGPIFIPDKVKQILDTDSARPDAQRRVLRSGRIMGGGVCSQPRLIRLQLISPSYRTTAAIERAINSRFPQRDKVADAVGDVFVDLRIPDEYATAPDRFVTLVQHMYLLQEVPGFSEHKAAELIRALADPRAPHRDLSIALQGLGKSILFDYIQPQYTSSNPTVRFWCARAGAAMHHVGGLVVLEEFVRDSASPLHDEAVKALIEVSRGAPNGQVLVALDYLLKSPKLEERLTAYEGMLAIGSPQIIGYPVGKKFWLDIVPCDSPPVIYVTQTGMPRIALIGRDIRLSPGTVYMSPDKLLTLSVDEETDAPTTMKSTAADASSKVVTAVQVSGAPATEPAAAQPPSTMPAEKQNVVLYWRSPFGDRSVTLVSNSYLAQVLRQLSWEPDPTNPNFNPNTPYIGASYQRVVEMLASMTKDQLVEAQFMLQKSGGAKHVAPADVVNNGRPEGLVNPVDHPGAAPAGPGAAAPQTQPSH